MKCCKLHNQKIAFIKLGLNANNEIKTTMNNINIPVQTMLKY